MMNFTLRETDHIMAVKERIVSFLHSFDISLIQGAGYIRPHFRSMYVSGGAIASLLQGETPKDYDVYFKDVYTMYKVRDFLMLNTHLVKDVDLKYKDHIGKDGKMITSQAITLPNTLSFITMHSGPPDEVKKTFDYVHCTPHYDIETNKLYISKQQYDCAASKVLMVNNYDALKPYRESKFLSRGYLKHKHLTPF